MKLTRREKVAAAAANMVEVYTTRPPRRSVHTPRTIRTSEPVSTGVPISNPNCVSDSPSSFLICTPMIEKIVHTAKQTVKAKVDIDSARVAEASAGVSGAGASTLCVIPGSIAGAGTPRHAENKKAAGQGFASRPWGAIILISSFAWGTPGTGRLWCGLVGLRKRKHDACQLAPKLELQ